MRSARRSAKSILVAGGAGFLGVHLCRELLKEGHRVICLDNFSSGCRSNLEQFSGARRFAILEQDVAQPIEVEVDQIFNFACVASPIKYQEDPLQTLHTSTTGIGNLLQLATRCRARIFHSSTSEVYGNPLEHPQHESYFGNVNPVGPRACYDEGKRCAETLCMDYHRVYGLQVKFARIFNTYGPHMHPEDGRVVSNFIVQALRNRPLTVYGDGSQTRSFCYVDDMIAGIRALMDSPRSVVGPVNLGNPGECTVLELARKIVDFVGSSSGIVFKPLPKDDPVRRQPDIGRARRLLQWEPRVALDNGLLRTIAWFDELLQAGAPGTAPLARPRLASADRPA